jgi:hypothetical protein
MAKLDKLITFAYLKDEVDIPQNIPDAELDNKIYLAQETLRMLMGETFYQNFLTNYKASTLSDPYNVLLPYMKQYIAWQAYEYWTVTANFKPTRSGFRVHKEDNSDAASDTQMAILIKDAKQRAQYYKTLFVEFLYSNRANYALYNQNCGQNLTGNSFHVSAVKNKDRDSFHPRNCRCRSCRW